MTKPLFYFALTLLSLGASVCTAQSDPWECCPPKRSLLVLEGGYAALAIPLTTQTSSGMGFGMEGYYLLDRHWLAGFGFSYFSTSENEINFTYTDLMLAVRYRLKRTGSGPYLMAGTGLLSENYSYEYEDLYVTALNHRLLDYPYAMAGVGWEYEMMKYTDLFVQLQARMVLEDNVRAFYFPLVAGINFGM